MYSGVFILAFCEKELVVFCQALAYVLCVYKLFSFADFREMFQVYICLIFTSMHQKAYGRSSRCTWLTFYQHVLVVGDISKGILTDV